MFQRCNGINIGDRLTDNAMRADDYRFHGAFHFAYVAVLTWSPVIRALFRLRINSTLCGHSARSMLAQRPAFQKGDYGARAVSQFEL
jgi:hypothetical protein